VETSVETSRCELCNINGMWKPWKPPQPYPRANYTLLSSKLTTSRRSTGQKVSTVSTVSTERQQNAVGAAPGMTGGRQAAPIEMRLFPVTEGRTP